jgi:hypothetical protein
VARSTLHVRDATNGKDGIVLFDKRTARIPTADPPEMATTMDRMPVLSVYHVLPTAPVVGTMNQNETGPALPQV